MMRIWFVQTGEPLPSDGANVRLFRAGLLADMLRTRGHEVIWWTATFDHFARKHRHSRDHSEMIRPGFTIKMIHSVGYRRNVSLMRLADHAQVAWRFGRLAGREPRPDIIHCSFPTIELSLAATLFGQRASVPVVLDIQDMWPDVFLDLVPERLRACAKLAVWPMYAMLAGCCRRATAITGMSPGFVDWGLSRARRRRTPLDRHFPFGYIPDKPDDRRIEDAKRYWSGWGVREGSGEFVVCFLGTIGRQFDLETVIRSAVSLRERSVPVKFVLCGDGDKLSYYRDMASGCKSVVFPGRVGWAELWTLMRLASAGLAPYRQTENFMRNMPNKIAEYLSAGLPIVCSLKGGYIDGLLSEHECGLSYSVGDVSALVSALEELRNNIGLRETMALKARNLFDKQFTVDIVYGEMSDYLEAVAKTKGSKAALERNGRL